MHEDSGGPVPLAAHDNIFDDTDLADRAPNAEDAYATEIKESAHARTELIALVATNLTKHQSISEVLAAAATADALQAYDTTDAVKESARVLRAPKGDTNLSERTPRRLTRVKISLVAPRLNARWGARGALMDRRWSAGGRPM
jgi:hypothetical protein